MVSTGPCRTLWGLQGLQTYSGTPMSYYNISLCTVIIQKHQKIGKWTIGQKEHQVYKRQRDEKVSMGPCHTLWGLQRLQTYTGTPMSSPQGVSILQYQSLHSDYLKCCWGGFSLWPLLEMRQIQLMVLPWIRLRLKPPKSSLRIISPPTSSSPPHLVRHKK